MTEPDEGRPGGPATPPHADPAPPVGDATPEAKADDTVAATPAPAEPTPLPTPTADAVPSPLPTPAADAIPTPPPLPTPPPAPAPAPTTAVVPAPTVSPVPAPSSSVSAYNDNLDEYEDELDPVVPRWVGLVTTAGAGMIGVVALQVLMALVEGLTLKKGQRFGVPDDFIHRIGYPFGSLGSTAMFFVVLGVLLLSLPAIFGDDVSDRQYGIAGAALRTALAVGVIVAVGSIMAVRGSLHEYSAKGVAVPGFVKVQFTSFLLATLAAAALAIFGAIAALRLRDDS